MLRSTHLAIACLTRKAPTQRRLRHWGWTHPTKAKAHGPWWSHGMGGAPYWQFLLPIIGVFAGTWGWGTWILHNNTIGVRSDNYEPDDALYFLWQALRKRSTARLYERKTRYENIFAPTVEAITEALGEDKIEEMKKDGQRHVLFWSKENSEPTELNQAISELVEAASGVSTTTPVPEATWTTDLLNATGASIELLNKAFIDFDSLSSTQQNTIVETLKAYTVVQSKLGAIRAERSDEQAQILTILKGARDEYSQIDTISSDQRRRLFVALGSTGNATMEILEQLAVDLKMNATPLNTVAQITDAASTACPLQILRSFTQAARKEGLTAKQASEAYQKIIQAAEYGGSPVIPNSDVDVSAVVEKARPCVLAAGKILKQAADAQAAIAEKAAAVAEQMKEVDIWVIEDDFGPKKAEYPYQQQELMETWLLTQPSIVGTALSQGTFDSRGKQLAAVDTKALWTSTISKLSKLQPGRAFKQHTYDVL